jgi:hypothetical protein
MSQERKKPGVAFWATTTVVAVLVGYPLSFGPACWWMSEIRENSTPMVNGISPRRVSKIYLPFGWVAVHGPAWAANTIRWYATCRIRYVLIPTDLEGKQWTAAFR